MQSAQLVPDAPLDRANPTGAQNARCAHFGRLSASRAGSTRILHPDGNRDSHASWGVRRMRDLSKNGCARLAGSLEKHTRYYHKGIVRSMDN